VLSRLRSSACRHDVRIPRPPLPGVFVRLTTTITAALLASVLTGGCAGLLPPTNTPTAPDTPRPSATPRTQAAAPTPLRLDPAVVEQMEEIENQVQALRGLRPSQPFERHLVTAGDLAGLIEQDLLAAYSPDQAADDSRLLALLGLVEPGFDLWGLATALYAEQVAGFYDDDAGVMYAVAGSGFGGPARLTYAHEYVHALQDQAFDFDLELRLSPAGCEDDGLRCLALQSLIEGDASLVEEQWLRTYATEADIEQLLTFYGVFESPVFDSMPPALQERFLFPYEQGLAFVRWVHRQGGWAQVDQVYQQPPLSDENILHPVGYRQDLPVALSVPALEATLLGGGWRTLDSGSLGEFDFRLVLAEALEPDRAVLASEGWGGDTYQAFYNDGQDHGALLIVQIWDTIRDSQDAFLAWRDYNDQRFGEHQLVEGAYLWPTDGAFAQLERASNQTLWLLGPDASSVEAMRGALTFPAAKQ